MPNAGRLVNLPGWLDYPSYELYITSAQAQEDDLDDHRHTPRGSICLLHGRLIARRLSGCLQEAVLPGLEYIADYFQRSAL